MTGNWRKGALALTIVTVLFVVLVAVLMGHAAAFKSEAAAVEIASVALFVILAAVIWFAGERAGRFRFTAFIALLFALRELDFHNWFYDPGFLQLRVMTSDAPLWVKVLGGVTMLGILTVLVLLVIRGMGPFLRGLRRGEGWAVALFVSLVLAAVSVLLDGPDRTAADLGITLSPGVAVALGGIEEVLEVFFGLGLIWTAALALEPARGR